MVTTAGVGDRRPTNRFCVLSLALFSFVLSHGPIRFPRLLWERLPWQATHVSILYHYIERMSNEQAHVKKVAACTLVRVFGVSQSEVLQCIGSGNLCVARATTHIPAHASSTPENACGVHLHIAGWLRGHSENKSQERLTFSGVSQPTSGGFFF